MPCGPICPLTPCGPGIPRGPWGPLSPGSVGGRGAGPWLPGGPWKPGAKHDQIISERKKCWLGPVSGGGRSLTCSPNVSFWTGSTPISLRTSHTWNTHQALFSFHSCRRKKKTCIKKKFLKNHVVIFLSCDVIGSDVYLFSQTHRLGPCIQMNLDFLWYLSNQQVQEIHLFLGHLFLQGYHPHQEILWVQEYLRENVILIICSRCKCKHLSCQ